MAFCKYCGKQIPEGGSCDCPASKAQDVAKEEADAVKEQAENVKDNIENAAENVKAEAESAVKEVKEGVENAEKKAEDAAEAVKEKVEEKASDVKESAESAVQNIKEGVTEAAQNVKEKAENAVDKAEDAVKKAGNDVAKKVDGVADEISEKLPGDMKNNKKAVYIAAGVIGILVLCLLMALCSAVNGPKATVKRFVKASASKSGGKSYYSLIYPDTVIKALKEDDKYRDLIDSYNERIEDKIDNLDGKETMARFNKIIRKNKLKKTELKGAEKYFRSICKQFDADDDDIKVRSGYEMRVKTKRKDEDGDADYQKFTVCVVKVKGDGWKIIPMDADSLESLAK